MLNLRNIPNFHVAFAVSTQQKGVGLVHYELSDFFSARHFEWNLGDNKSTTLDHAPSAQKSIITATHYYTRLIFSINFWVRGKLNDKDLTEIIRYERLTVKAGCASLPYLQESCFD
jgi:hypothetical protein